MKLRLILLMLALSLAGSLFIWKPSFAQENDGLSFVHQDKNSIIISNIKTNTNPGSATTVEFWMKYDGSGGMPITWTGTNYSLYFTGGYFGFNTNNADVFGVKSDSFINKWVHVGAVFINEKPTINNVKLYINGVRKKLTEIQNGGHTASVTVSNQLKVACFHNDKYCFNGPLKDLRVWNNERSASQIQYDMSHDLKGNESGLVGYWKIDPTNTGVVYDLSPYGNDGKVLNFTAPNFDLEDTLSGVKVTSDYHDVTHHITRDNSTVYTGESVPYVDLAPPGKTHNYQYYLTTPNGRSLIRSQSIFVKEGSLELISVPAEGDFSPVTLNGQNQKVKGSLDSKLVVRDGRKTGEGWHVTVSSTPLKDEVSNTMPGNSLTLDSPVSILNTDKTTSKSPSILKGAYILNNQAKTILKADTKEGMGTYDISFPRNALVLQISPSTLVDQSDQSSNYQSTLTWTLISGP